MDQCQFCGGILGAKVRFCSNCGKPVIANKAPDSSIPKVGPIAVAREIKAKAISVATGKFSQSDLAFFMPDLLIENLEFCSDKLSGFLKIAEVTIE